MFSVFDPFLFRGLTWAVLRAWSQNHTQVVGTCPGHHSLPIGQKSVFKIETPKPPPSLKEHGSKDIKLNENAEKAIFKDIACINRAWPKIRFGAVRYL